MVQGTMSGVGKSLIVAGLCRVMRRRGYRVAPFKAQNMALNSYVTEEGLEMGRAQAMQAEAAGIKPMVCMNPILLKPTNHTGSQVIINGRAIGNMGAKEYFDYRKNAVSAVKNAFEQLTEFADIIVIEGAGSPAEINLRENDIVNMGLAKMLDAPVILVGDIDRGGIFAQLWGTFALLPKKERECVKGMIVNKFRGDMSLFSSGISILEQKCKRPVLGVVPYMELLLEDEDSLSDRFENTKTGTVDIAVIRYPRISNFTDFNVFEQIPEAAVRYVDSVFKLGNPDLIFLPGSKNTIEDLQWMRQNGIETKVKEFAEEIPICGICGGYQMLGEQILDPLGVEGGGAVNGMGFLPVVTTLQSEKVRRQVSGKIDRMYGIFGVLSGLEYCGYEIHMGKTDFWAAGKMKNTAFVSGKNKNVYGTYIHGIFDNGTAALSLVKALAEKKGVLIESTAVKDYADFKEEQYDRLADTLSECLNMEEIYGMLRETGFT